MKKDNRDDEAHQWWVAAIGMAQSQGLRVFSGWRNAAPAGDDGVWFALSGLARSWFGACRMADLPSVV